MLMQAVPVSLGKVMKCSSWLMSARRTIMSAFETSLLHRAKGMEHFFYFRSINVVLIKRFCSLRFVFRVVFVVYFIRLLVWSVIVRRF